MRVELALDGAPEFVRNFDGKGDVFPVVQHDQFDGQATAIQLMHGCQDLSHEQRATLVVGRNTQDTQHARTVSITC